MDPYYKVKAKIKSYNYNHKKVEELLARLFLSANEVKKELNQKSH